LKQLTLYIILFCLHQQCLSQTIHLKLKGLTLKETKTVDSLSYITIHKNTKSITDELTNFSQTLYKKGYIENRISQITKTNDSSYIAVTSLGEKTNYMYLYIGALLTLNQNLIKKTSSDTVKIPFQETDLFLNQIIEELEKEGYLLTKLKLSDFTKKDANLYAKLNITTEKSRRVNSIIVNYSKKEDQESFPKGHLYQLSRKYRNKIANRTTVSEIYNDLKKYSFINIVKAPEILLTKDSTKVYIYLEKKKINNFDGYIGFNNTESKKIKINGFLDLKLENTIKSGEKFNLYWKNDGNKQTTFKVNLEMPYLFKSPLGLKTEINIFKKDSAYQNTKTGIDLGYLINYNTKVYAGYESTVSSDILNKKNEIISDFKNYYLTVDFEYSTFSQNYNHKLKNSQLLFKSGIGTRAISNTNFSYNKNNQFYIDINALKTIFLNRKNAVNVNIQTYYLNSNQYLLNELPLFGGIKTIRGFTENSLLGNFYSAVLTEYRFYPSHNLYINTISDYALIKNPLDKSKTKQLISFGIGTAIQNKNGTVKISVANGNELKQDIRLSNSIFNLSYNLDF
jgi:hypothetical protein